jgi:hypothetical protein
MKAEMDLLESKKSQARHVVQPKKNNLEFLVSVKKNPNFGTTKSTKELSEGTVIIFLI